MVAIFTGQGFGFERGSGSVLGGTGILGSAGQGVGGEGVFVNAATGNLVLQKQDEFLVGIGPDAAISRTYNSLTNLADDNGDKWRQSTDRRITGFPATYGAAGSTIKRVAGDGSEITYTWNAAWRNGAGAYVATDGGGAFDTLVKAGNTWTWTDGDTNFYEAYYDDTAGVLAGRIQSVNDRSGKTLAFSYVAGTSRLDKVTTSSGDWIQYGYDANGNVTSVVTGYDQATSPKTLTRTVYGYTANRLTTVTVDLTPEDAADNKTYITTYGYDGAGRVNAISQSDGSAMAIEYDASGRVWRLTQTVAAGETRVTALTYGAGYTTITDPALQDTRLDYDSNGNLTKITAPPAAVGAAQQIAQFTYDAAGNLTQVTDAAGASSYYQNYTVDGLAQTLIDRTGRTTTRTFGSINTATNAVLPYGVATPYAATDDVGLITNVLLSETVQGVDQSGSEVAETTRFVYNANGDIAYRISAEGRVTEYSYLWRILTDETTFTDIACTGTGTPSLNDLDAWRNNTVTDKSAIARVKYAIGSRGEVTSATTFGAYSAAGVGNSAEGLSQTFYVYDQAGQLKQTYRNQFGAGTNYNTVSYVYDGLGRVVAATDSSGATTTFVFDDSGAQHGGQTTTTVTLASGYVVTKTYNKAGDLVAQTDSGANVTGGTTQYAYDKLGRVRVRTDAVNQTKTYMLYDNAGRLTGEVDNAGYLTEYRYDAANRLVGTIHYRTISTANLSNSAAPETWLGNPNNSATIASIRPANPTAQDVSSWTVYDAEGRVVQTIAGDGSTVVSTFDSAGRVQKSTAYFNKIAAATMASVYAGSPAGLTLPTADAARDSVARSFYDRDGRMIGSLDGEGYLIQNGYDKAGRLVSTTAFATQVTQANRAAATFAALLGEVGTTVSDRTTRMVYDSRGLLRFKIDALGQITEYAYANSTDKLIIEARYDAALGALSNYSYQSVSAARSALPATAATRRSYVVYDQAERAGFTIDAAGMVSQLVYDSSGRLIKTVQFSTLYTGGYTDIGGMNSWAAGHVNDAGNRTTRTWYSERGEAVYVMDGEGQLARSTFDADGRMVSSTIYTATIAANDSTSILDLNAVAVSGTTVSRAYDSLGRLVSETDGAGAQTAYAYFGTTSLVVSKIEANAGNAIERAKTNTAYDAAGRIVQVTAGAGSANMGEVNAVSLVTYDGKGKALSQTDPRGKITNYTYDLAGRVKTVTDALNNVTTYDYNAFGEVWKVTSPNNQAGSAVVTYNWYDRLGRVTTSRDAGDYVTKTAYTLFGEIASVTRYSLKAVGTAAMGVEPGGTGTEATTSFTYDKRGRVLSTTDAEGNAGHAASPGESRTETFTYDAFGNRSTSTSRLGALTIFSYDKVGRLIRQSVAAATTNDNPSGGTIAGSHTVTTYAYDTRGNVTAKAEGFSTIADGAVTALRTTTFKYDGANRVTETWHDAVSIIADDMVTVTGNVIPKEFFTYDQRGNLIKFIDAGGAQTFSWYDDLGRKTAEVRQLSASQWCHTAYVYDANGNLTSTRVYESNAGQPAAAGGAAPAAPAGAWRQTDFTYDDLNRLKTSRIVSTATNAIVSGSWSGTAPAGSYVTNQGSTVADTVDLITTYDYDAFGNVVKVTDPNGGTSFSWFDTLGRKTKQLDAAGYLTKWDYNSEGNVLSETRFSVGIAGTPAPATPPADPAVDADKRVTDFEYDLVGNRIRETRRNVVAWAVDSSTGALSGGTAADSLIVYEYNALGQVRSKTVAGVQIASYTYDQSARLASEAKSSFIDANGNLVTPSTSYSYDAIGNLIRSTQAGTAAGTYSAADRITTYRYGEGGRLIALTDAEGNAHTYSYDVMGRQKKDAYARIVNEDNTVGSATTALVVEARGTLYDISGRALSQSVYSTVSGSLTRIDVASFQYNNFGQVTAQGSGTDSASGLTTGNALYQTQNQYDGAGRLVASNSGDGVWKYFGYDKLGNQTVAITSAGYALNSATGFAAALANVSAADLNATYTIYDKRNQAVQVLEEGRNLSATVVNQSLLTRRSFNAFGEITSETNARDAVVTYTYNTMGRRTRSESPAVQITLENGLEIWAKPAEDYFYDLAGRLIAMRDANGTYGNAANTQATAYTKTGPGAGNSGTGNLTSFAYISGTGYDGTAGLIATEFHSDGSKKQTLFDVMGDARVLRDELYKYTGQTAADDSLHFSEQSFNRLGQLVQTKHNRATDTTLADDSTRLIDNYVYDQFGQRIQHWNSLYGSATREKTTFDALGRQTVQSDMLGNLTTTSLTWDGTIAASGIGTFGGWKEIVTYANGKTLQTKTDAFGRQVWKQDLGGNVSSLAFNAAGWLISGLAQTITYYNTGQISSSKITMSGAPGTGNLYTRTTGYSYDAVGNRLTETLTYVDKHREWDAEAKKYFPVTDTYYYGNKTATYDALNRLTSMTEAGSVDMAGATITEKYDANSNIRRTIGTHYTLDSNGTVSTAQVTDDFWFAYDAMNRMTINRGMLNGAAGGTNTTIVRSYVANRPELGGENLLYDAAGQRIAMVRTNYNLSTYQEVREIYAYNGAGQMESISLTSGTATTSPATMGAAPATGGFLTSSFGYDRMGRQTSQSDYQSGVTGSVFSRTATYAANGRLSSDVSSTRKTDNNVYSITTNYDYGSGTAYALGAVVTVTATNSKNGVYQSTSTTSNTYTWWDGAQQGTVTYYDSAAGSTFTTTFNYDAMGQSSSISIADGRPRTVNLVLNAEGQIVKRDEGDANYTQGDPHEIWYRFNGRELGYVGNNGTSRLAADSAVADRRVLSGTGAFRNGSTTGTGYNDFSTAYDPLNSYAQGSGAGSYTVQRSGETLTGVAQQLYGDSSLWYKIAEANGMAGDARLVEGQRLNLPAGVSRSHNNASSLKPYDANEAIGNVSPTTPKPATRKCGVFGMILLAAIAIAVTVLLKVPIANMLAPGAGAAAAGSTAMIAGTAMASMAGSVVSQAVGLATGIQDKFSFGAVAMAGIGALAGGFAGKWMPSKLLGSTFLGDVAQGAAGSAATQGIGVATGLQDKFSWAGVAAAGIGSAVGNGIGRGLNDGKLLGLKATGTWNDIASTAASTLANSATRSAIEGSNFGDNLLAALPDAIGGVLGRAMGDAAVKALSSKQTAAASADPSNTVAPTVGYDAQIVVNQAALDDVEQSLLGLDDLGIGIMSEDEILLKTRMPASEAAKFTSDPVILEKIRIRDEMVATIVIANDPRPADKERFQSAELNDAYRNSEISFSPSYFEYNRRYDYWLSVKHKGTPKDIEMQELAFAQDKARLDAAYAIADKEVNNILYYGAGLPAQLAIETATGELLIGGGVRVYRFYRYGRTAESATARAVRLGTAGEQAVGLSGAKVGIRIPGSNNLRFPDSLTATTLTEVKNVGRQALTSQLNDYITFSKANNLDFELFFRGPLHPLGETRLTRPLADAIRRGDIIPRFIPGTF